MKRKISDHDISHEWEDVITHLGNIIDTLKTEKDKNDCWDKYNELEQFISERMV